MSTAGTLPIPLPDAFSVIQPAGCERGKNSFGISNGGPELGSVLMVLTP